jgi:hypothetical protein
MSDLIARAFAEKAQIDAEVAENHAREKAEAAKEMLAATREALAYLFGVTPSEMVDESGDWSTVRVGDLRFAGHFNGAASWVRLVLPCPDCGELKSTDRITSLYDLAEVIEQVRSGKRYGYNDRPVWMWAEHDCSARVAMPAPAPAPFSVEQRLVALIREIVNEEIEAR